MTAGVVQDEIVLGLEPTGDVAPTQPVVGQTVSQHHRGQGAPGSMVVKDRAVDVDSTL